MKITLRPATKAERQGQVRSHWLRHTLPTRDNARDGMLWWSKRGRNSMASLGIARRAFTLAIEDLLADPDVTVTVATFEDIEGELLGWIAHTGKVLHFVVVPGGYGRRGIGRRLYEDAGEPGEPTFLTANGKRFLQSVASM